ncbi:hypothetical protein KRX51_01490 [Corynebacterium sp. TAE3-ERU12]|uniref:GAP1-N2 domain-containing protein n=1 Tax=Corynebacterium sp. TAE3-ERU12 TaxID=2849491 RepID=UPI001C44663D|nr:hypothetical protein [Corynebacterium sp. TAE3-ERU12]MBV7294589.1 hypothetical protein [Corynebacterium sp. TAE3-ERU12]
MSGVDVLTYASHASGWSVGHHSAGLQPDEIARLAEWAPTRLATTTPIPAYPSAAEVACLPRRTAWLPAPWGGADRVFFHSVPAGADGSGRAGNIYTQAHIVRGNAAGQWRPSDGFHSPCLRTPFGVVEVNAARPDAVVPADGPLADAAAVWSFIFDPGPVDRRAVLAAIIDAWVSGAVVAIACPPQQAEIWIAALLHTTSAQVAREISFSSWQRATSLDALLHEDLRLVAIPPEDMAQASRQPGVIVVDTAVSPATGIYGQRPTVLSDGTELEVSEWSELLVNICFSAADAVAASTGASGGGGGLATHPAGMLAAVAEASPELRQELAQPLRCVRAGTTADPAPACSLAPLVAAQVRAISADTLRSVIADPHLCGADGERVGLLGDILRLDPAGDALVERAQQRILAAALVEMCRDGATSGVDYLPWWRAEYVSAAQRAGVAASVAECLGADPAAGAALGELATAPGPNGRRLLAQAAYDRLTG